VRRLLHLAGRVSLDVSALREHAAFRRMFAAQLLSQIGTQVTVVALMYQVYQLTDSTLMVGLLGLVQFAPTMVFALLGGAIADAMDRRKLLLLVQVLMFCVSGALTLGALGEPPLWLLYVIAAFGAAFAAVDGPARTAVIPSLVDEHTLRSAIQLREVLTQSGRVFGPVAGGFLIAQVGLAAAYAVDAASFAIAFLLFLGLPSLRPEQRRRFELSSITEGLKFVGTRPVLAATFYADLVAMILGMPRAVFPAFQEDVFHAGPEVLGMLYAAPAAGAMLGLLLGGLYRNVRREGLAVIVSVAVWGLATAAFALSPWLWLGLALLAIAGWADMVSALFRQTILMETVPDELRGRMSAVHIMIVTGGPPLGDLRAGATAEAWGIRPATIAGGLACAAGMVALAARIPAFTGYLRPEQPRAASPPDQDPPPPAGD
jgi:MFS family permease